MFLLAPILKIFVFPVLAVGGLALAVHFWVEKRDAVKETKALAKKMEQQRKVSTRSAIILKEAIQTGEDIRRARQELSFSADVSDDSREKKIKAILDMERGLSGPQ